MFSAFQALKWVATVTVPLERFVRRTDQYCWKVAVPMMEGWLVRVLCDVVSALSFIFSREKREEPLREQIQEFPYLVDIVCISIGNDRTLLCSSTAGIVGAEVLNDIILDQRILRPSINREVAVAVWLIGTSVLDRSIIQSAYSLSSQAHESSGLLTGLKFLASIPYHQQDFRFRTR